MDKHRKMTIGFLLVVALVFAIIIEILLFIVLQDFIKIEQDVQLHQQEYIRLEKAD